MSCCVDFKFVDLIYPFESNVEINATSENVNFPASNLSSEFRSKVWRSSGFYEITTSNNKINFKESAMGAELTATLAIGEYSVSTLALEIKNALESVGTETYAVSFGSGTGKWTIAHAGSYLDLLFSTGSDGATSIRNTIGFGVNDYSGGVSYVGAFVALHTSERIVFDLQTSEEIDTFAILFDPKRGIQLSESATITLKASHSDSWAAPVLSQSVSIDENLSIVTHFFTTAQEFRYWCIEIVDPKNPNLYVEIGTVVLGLSEVLERAPDNGFSYSIADKSKLDRTEYGHVYADIFPMQKTLSFTFGIFEYSQVQLMEQIFNRVGGNKPIFVALDTSEMIFDKDNFTMIGRLELGLDFDHINRGYFSKKLKILESF
jgi:hypothetical protein